MNKITIFLLFAIAPTHVYAGVPLEGDYQLAGPLTHKGAISPGKSHLYFNLTGSAAKKLFNKLEGAAAFDHCTDYLTKGAGNVVCFTTKAKKKYYCSFSINLKKAKVETGLGGCF